MNKLFLIIIALTANFAYAQTTWHVDASRHGDTGDGTGWGTTSELM